MPNQKEVESPVGDTRARPLHEDISRRARERWERLGRPEGRDQEIWLEAERELLKEATGPTAQGPGTMPRHYSEPPPARPAGGRARRARTAAR